MSHIWRTCHTYEGHVTHMKDMSHIWRTCHTYEGHVTHMKDMRHAGSTSYVWHKVRSTCYVWHKMCDIRCGWRRSPQWRHNPEAFSLGHKTRQGGSQWAVDEQIVPWVRKLARNWYSTCYCCFYCCSSYCCSSYCCSSCWCCSYCGAFTAAPCHTYEAVSSSYCGSFCWCSSYCPVCSTNRAAPK